MRDRFSRIVGMGSLFLFLGHAPALAQPAKEPGIAKQADEIVANYRKIIVLMDGEGTLDPGVRERVSTLGKILFQQNQERLSTLEEQLLATISKGSTALAEEFLGRLETHPEYRDADKLAFRDLL